MVQPLKQDVGRAYIRAYREELLQLASAPCTHLLASWTAFIVKSAATVVGLVLSALLQYKMTTPKTLHQSKTSDQVPRLRSSVLQQAQPGKSSASPPEPQSNLEFSIAVTNINWDTFELELALAQYYRERHSHFSQLCLTDLTGLYLPLSGCKPAKQKKIRTLITKGALKASDAEGYCYLKMHVEVHLVESVPVPLYARISQNKRKTPEIPDKLRDAVPHLRDLGPLPVLAVDDGYGFFPVLYFVDPKESGLKSLCLQYLDFCIIQSGQSRSLRHWNEFVALEGQRGHYGYRPYLPLLSFNVDKGKRPLAILVCLGNSKSLREKLPQLLIRHNTVFFQQANPESYESYELKVKARAKAILGGRHQ